MADTIAVDFDVLSSHATRVDQVASDVGVAAQAASSMSMSGDAFGVMCAFMVPPAELVATMARGALASAQEMVSRSAEGIRGVRDDFASFEETASNGLKALGTELGGSAR